jgi:hypothetical protein
MIQPTNKIPEKSEIEIVATQKTKTISGKTTLTYHLGKDEESNPWVRAWSSSGSGFFSNEYLLISRIIEILEQQKGASFTSFVFQPLFKGKSVNTPGFLVAILLAEKIIALEPGKQRKYVYVSADKLLANIENSKPRKAVKKAAAKAAVKSAK